MQLRAVSNVGSSVSTWVQLYFSVVDGLGASLSLLSLCYVSLSHFCLLLRCFRPHGFVLGDRNVYIVGNYANEVAWLRLDGSVNLTLQAPVTSVYLVIDGMFFYILSLAFIGVDIGLKVVIPAST